MDWRQKLDPQRGAVLATELKNNSCKIAKWALCSHLAGTSFIKFGWDASPARSVLERENRVERKMERVYIVFVWFIHCMALFPLAMYHGNILVTPPTMKFSVYSRWNLQNWPKWQLSTSTTRGECCKPLWMCSEDFHEKKKQASIWFWKTLTRWAVMIIGQVRASPPVVQLEYLYMYIHVVYYQIPNIFLIKYRARIFIVMLCIQYTPLYSTAGSMNKSRHKWVNCAIL